MRMDVICASRFPIQLLEKQVAILSKLQQKVRRAPWSPWSTSSPKGSHVTLPPQAALTEV